MGMFIRALRIFLVLLFVSTIASEARSQEVETWYSGNSQESVREYFGLQWENSLDFFKSKIGTWIPAIHDSGTDPAFLLSIVFPETLRYSEFKENVETAALRILYVNYGQGAANFSVGRFQMKPGFAETIENLARRFPDLAESRLSVTFPRGLSRTETRSLRILRLRNDVWQIKYLILFCKLADRFYAPLKFPDTKSKLAFYATVYNSGFQNHKMIQKIMNQRLFPHGTLYPGDQLSYGDVAVSFYTLEIQNLLKDSKK